MELVLSRETVGAAQTEGLMQNRRSSDPSEIFDIRDYVPGDDIRTVHWKLSAKTGSLIVRQASDPSHYDAALLPDLGLRQQGETRPTAKELVRAVSVTVALGEGLLRQGTAFCMVIPIPQGLELHEVRIPAESGLGCISSRPSIWRAILPARWWSPPGAMPRIPAGWTGGAA